MILDAHVTEDEFNSWKNGCYQPFVDWVGLREKELVTQIGQCNEFGPRLAQAQLDLATLQANLSEALGSLAKLEALLDSGLHSRLKPLFESQLAEIDKKLDALRLLEQSTCQQSVDVAAAREACEVIQKTLRNLESSLQQWGKQTKAGLEEEIAAASARLAQGLDEMQHVLEEIRTARDSAQEAKGGCAQSFAGAKAESEAAGVAATSAREARDSAQQAAQGCTVIREDLVHQHEEMKRAWVTLKGQADTATQTAARTAQETAAFMAGCHSFWGRLCWLFGGPRSAHK